MDFSVIPEERRLVLLDFYAAVIPHIMDPMREVRFGATAMNLFRVQHPNATFQEERDAIVRFMPNASEVRDDQIKLLFDRHLVPVIPNAVGPDGEPIDHGGVEDVQGISEDEIDRTRNLYFSRS